MLGSEPVVASWPPQQSHGKLKAYSFENVLSPVLCNCWMKGSEPQSFTHFGDSAPNSPSHVVTLYTTLLLSNSANLGAWSTSVEGGNRGEALILTKVFEARAMLLAGFSIIQWACFHKITWMSSMTLHAEFGFHFVCVLTRRPRHHHVGTCDGGIMPYMIGSYSTKVTVPMNGSCKSRVSQWMFHAAPTRTALAGCR